MSRNRTGTPAVKRANRCATRNAAKDRPIRRRPAAGRWDRADPRTSCSERLISVTQLTAVSRPPGVRVAGSCPRTDGRSMPSSESLLGYFSSSCTTASCDRLVRRWHRERPPERSRPSDDQRDLRVRLQSPTDTSSRVALPRANEDVVAVDDDPDDRAPRRAVRVGGSRSRLLSRRAGSAASNVEVIALVDRLQAEHVAQAERGLVVLTRPVEVRAHGQPAVLRFRRRDPARRRARPRG